MGDPVVDDARAHPELLRYLLHCLFSRLLLVYRCNRMLVSYPGNTRAGEEVAFVTLEALGVELGGDLVIGVVPC